MEERELGVVEVLRGGIFLYRPQDITNQADLSAFYLLEEPDDFFDRGERFSGEGFGGGGGAGYCDWGFDLWKTLCICEGKW